MCIKFVIKTRINNTKNEICCLLTYQVRSQLCKFPSFQVSSSLKLQHSLTLIFLSGSPGVPGLNVSQAWLLATGQGWCMGRDGGLINSRLSPGQSLCVKHQKSIYLPEVTGKNHGGHLSLEFWDEALEWVTLTNSSIVNTIYPPGRGFP